MTRPKSEFQKDDCIRACGRPSTLEAVSGCAAVRCCDTRECISFAENLAENLGALRVNARYTLTSLASMEHER